MKIAILHEMLVKLGWAEKVLECLVKIFPKADIFTLIYDEKKVKNIFPKNKINKQVFSTSSQRMYKITKNQRLSLIFMAKSVESFDFSDYDYVICSSSSFAHWAITKPETKFIVYYHSPSRYLWDWTNEYKRDIWWNKWIKWLILNKIFLNLRKWDFIASNRSDVILANSNNTSLRIKKYYKKKSEILYPPVEVERFQKKVNLSLEKVFKWKINSSDYYIIISALTEFKKIDVAIKAFNNLKDKKLVIIWEWNYRKELEKIASNNIKFVWFQSWDELVLLVQNSLGLIFPWEEDFWIVPIEVMAAWKPVFAYKWGGLLETVIKWKTWEFFKDKEGIDFIEKFKKFDKNNINWKYKSKDCINQANKFSWKEFKKRITSLIK